jgi:hypothetical protein
MTNMGDELEVKVVYPFVQQVNCSYFVYLHQSFTGKAGLLSNQTPGLPELAYGPGSSSPCVIDG